jgi:NAD(P) transhydrogenase subunit alpha
MTVYFPREPGAARVALTPDNAGKLVKSGFRVLVGKGLGDALGWSDGQYEAKGAELTDDAAKALAEAGLVVRVDKPPASSAAARGAVHIGSLDPFRERMLVDGLAADGVSAISVEMIPRTTIAQKMDVLSSQASLAGYAAVILAAERLDRVFPMMMTPSGTIAAAKVFVVGAGVAGLQAIATAKRLGAKVEAFDTRPAVEEQVQSLGAKFVKVDLGETGQTEQGYAKALTEEQLAKQREVMAKQVAQSDVVITTAQVFGRPAPRILTTAMLGAMRPGGVVIDMAAATGGQCRGLRARGGKDGRRRFACRGAQSGGPRGGQCQPDAFEQLPRADRAPLGQGGQGAQSRSVRRNSFRLPAHARRPRGASAVPQSVMITPFLAAAEPAGLGAYIPLIFVFILATFIGLDVIRNVSRLLHTPLMSLTNAISAIVIVGAILVAGPRAGDEHPLWISILGLVAIAAASVNIVSGFLITNRMLKMFKSRKPEDKA